jgi:hypothetical protein
VKARVWKDRDSGRWCFDVLGHGLRVAGDRTTWDGALSVALDDMRWIAEHRGAWRQS